MRESAEVRERARSGNVTRRRNDANHGCYQARNQDGCLSLFVDNLPQAMTREWLKQIFKCYANLLNVFLSHKIRKKDNNLFGFVKFGSRMETKKVAEKLNRVTIRGCKIAVILAKYERRRKFENQRCQQTRKDIKPFLSACDGQSYKEVAATRRSNEQGKEGYVSGKRRD